MWMDLETVKQSEGSQKEKNKYILMHTCGIQKNGIDELICKAEIETQMQRTNMDAKGGKWGRMNWDIQIDTYILLCITQIGEGNGTPLQASCLENPMDGGAWQAAVHGVANSRTRLSDFTFTFHFHALEKEMATHSGVLAQRIPVTGESGGLPSMGSHRVGHD